MGVDLSSISPLIVIASAALTGAVLAVPAQIFMAQYEARWPLWQAALLLALTGGATCYFTTADPRALALLFASFALMVGAMIDIKVARLPDLLTGPLFLYAMGLAVIGLGPAPLDALIGAAIGFGSLLGLELFYQWIRGRSGVGGGDIKLAASLGAFIALPDIVLVLMGAALLHSAMGIALIIVRQKKLASEMPFGPALVLVTWALLMFPANPA